MTLVDSNVLIDLLVDDSDWFDWSLARLREALLRGPLLINDIVYAETSTRFSDVEEFDSVLSIANVSMVSIPGSALFLAGKAFLKYRRLGGTKTGVLPDFFIGAHAVVGKLPLLTRDVRRYRTYFPTIDLITPDSDPL